MNIPGYRSGFVALVGRPNVGKSTLLNRLLGGKVAIISDKPQTTRTRILGVKHLPGAQMVFLDTPGIHKPKFRLNQRMVDVALHVLDEVDLAFFLVEATDAPGPGDRFVLERLKERKLPVFLVVNKIDLVKKLRLLPLLDEYQRMHEFAEIVPISAKTGDGVDRLVDLALARMPEGPVYFPEDVMTDQPMRILAAEIIREKLLQKTRDELPFAVAVGIDSFKEEGKLARISATVYVEKESQKAIVIGRQGEILKAVGTYARIDMENLFGMKVFLQLWVKVKESWRQDERMLVELGY
ncbi:MAG TPA: GTPase Era [Nitrospirales bacterium]|nr:GTPase Era [Nitrospirales bacterium]